MKMMEVRSEEAHPVENMLRGREINVLGVRVSAIDMAGALDRIERWIVDREFHYVCVTGVHGVMESQRAHDLRIIHNAAGMVTPDGMPMVWLGWVHGHWGMRRVYGPDLLLELCKRSLDRGYSHYFYGGAEGVAERLAGRLEGIFPSIRIVGVESPPFRPLTADEDRAAVERINAHAPDVVWVGLGTPKQEYWMAAHLGRIKAPVMIGVGAAFDFHAGLKRQAPIWIQRSGTEWLFRLIAEPRRLWRRYLMNNPSFVLLAAMQLMGIKKYD